MELSFEILKKFCGQWLTENIVESSLLNGGFEVDKITKIDLLWDKLIVGKIIDIQPHPRSTKLKVCTVFNGSVNLQVVCGAPIVELRCYIFAPVGSIVNGVTLDVISLRGVESNGMLCSFHELGLSNVKDNTLAPSNGNPGDIIDLWCKDTVFSVSIPANRGDCHSYIGLAREIIAYYNYKNNTNHVLNMDIGHYNLGKYLDVNINIKNNTETCKGYGFGSLELNDKSMPLWIIYGLKVSNISSKSLAVDLTNFIMIITNQPSHGYDMIDNTIEINNYTGEFTALNGNIYHLNNNMVISNNGNILSLGGIMGSNNYKLTNVSKRIIIEFLYVDVVNIFKTSHALQLYTDASFRFSRYSSPTAILDSIKILNCFIKDMKWQLYNVNEPSQDIHYVNNVDNHTFISEVNAHTITQNPNAYFIDNGMIFNITNIPMTLKEQRRILECLGYTVLLSTENKDNHHSNQNIGLRVNYPHYRKDIKCIEDVLNDILRLYGVNNIPTDDTIYINKNLKYTSRDEQIKSTLRSMGYYHVINTVCDNKDSQLRYGNVNISITNGLSHKDTLRISLIPQLMDVLIKNINNCTVKGLKLFDVGVIYKNKKETKSWVCMSWGSSNIFESIDKSSNTLNTLIGECLNTFQLNYSNLTKCSHESFDINKSYDISVNGEIIGHCGVLNIDNLNIYDVFTFEIFSEIHTTNNNNTITNVLINNYLDVTLSISDHIKSSEIREKLYNFHESIFKVYEIDTFIKHPGFREISYRIHTNNKNLPVLNQQILSQFKNII